MYDEQDGWHNTDDYESMERDEHVVSRLCFHRHLNLCRGAVENARTNKTDPPLFLAGEMSIRLMQ